MPEILITGGAGFIGSHLVDRLLAKGDRVTVLDNFCDFYDPDVKQDNIAAHAENQNFTLVRGDIRDVRDLETTFERGNFDAVVHLAAMAGVRPSLINPSLYMDVNVVGTQRLLDRINKQAKPPLLVFGSSSSVYGERSEEEFYETDRIDRPLSPYAASKIASEAACFAAHHTTGLNVVALRFFTVFGPRQRPDLAIHKFCDLIYNDRPIELFGDGTSKRDYTFIADIVNGIERSIGLEQPGYEVINLGRSSPVLLSDLIACLETSLGKKARIDYKPMQIGDVPNTYAGIDKARQLLGYEPSTSIEQGIEQFVQWYVASKAKRKAAATLR
jgi:UDP-glucuronate 4-epimerase